jgi:hypothetical protein
MLSAFHIIHRLNLPRALPRSFVVYIIAIISSLSVVQAQTPPPRPDLVQNAINDVLTVPEETEQAFGELKLSAFLTGDNRPISKGLTWRVFHEQDPTTTVLAHSDEAQPVFKLPSGAYLVHVTFGYASATKRLILKSGAINVEKLTMSAGALKLAAAIGDTLISSSQVSFSVFVPFGANSEGRLVLKSARTGDLIRLPEGNYHVVSQYGDSNSIMRSDLKVENGKVTEATLNHRAATITVKLVTALGAEALAGTAFSVLTPGGDVVREAIGAFPQMVLAEGDYVLIARHDGQLYTRDFKVQSSSNREIEIEAK